jgi:integrase
MNPHDPTDNLVAKLQSAGCDPRETGPDSWESRCPSHNGSRSNLSVKRGDDGRVLLFCHHVPECDHKAIARALKMDVSDLFSPPPTPEDALAHLIRQHGRPTGHWIYPLTAGRESFRVYRFDFKKRGKPDKTFRPVHPVPGGWKLSDPPGPLPLYRLPELAGAGRIYVCEGEKAADLVRDLGLTATTSAHGAKHARMTVSRAGKVLTLTGIRRVSDLLMSKVQAALPMLRSEGLGMETINHHVRAVKAFSRWLWRDGRAREHFLAHLSTSNAAADRRRQRRALTPEEANRLVQAAERGPMVKGMTGPDRARCYALALGTGLRAAELASLTPERFDLDADPPTVTVQAGYTKNGKEAVQPVAPVLADRLALWLAALPPGQPVFSLPKRTAAMIRVDLEAAGIAYETHSGVVDFHALRGCYISFLVSSGASVKTCQTLARHSTPSLTIGIYAKASLHDISGAVDALPDLSPVNPAPEPMAATGTDPVTRDRQVLTAHGQRTEDGTWHVGADAGGLDEKPPEVGGCRNTLGSPVLDGSRRALAGTVASSGGGTRTPDTRIMIPLPNRHKSKADNAETHIDRRRALPLPIDTRQRDAGLTAVLEAWPKLPEALRAGILAMIRVATEGTR